jgi:hypothetical protein
MMSLRSWSSVLVLPAFALLALGSSAPKKGDATPEGGVTTTSATGSAPNAAASDEVPANHCDVAAEGLCTESFFGDDDDKAECDRQHGTFEKGTRCPKRDTLLGVCAMSGKLLGAPMLVNKLHFYSVNGGRSLEDAKVACSANGPGGKGPEGTEIVYQWADGPAATSKKVASPQKAAPASAPAKGAAKAKK